MPRANYNQDFMVALYNGEYCTHPHPQNFQVKTSQILWLISIYTVSFNDMWTLLNQWFCFSLPGQSSYTGTLVKQKITSMGSKGHVRGLWLVDFNPFCLFLFSRSVGCRRNMIDVSEKCNIELQSSPVVERRSNIMHFTTGSLLLLLLLAFFI